MGYQYRGQMLCVDCGLANAIGRKLCRPCYERHIRNGTLEQFPVLQPNDVFERRIKKTKTCWLWLGGTNGYGYGIFILPGEIKKRAHRYAYEYFIGKIPKGKIVMHTCDNPPCVNPKHLRVGTKDDNNKGTGNKRRHHYGLDHWNGKLSDDQVRDIRRSPLPQWKLAGIHKISRASISAIKRRKQRPYID